MDTRTEQAWQEMLRESGLTDPGFHCYAQVIAAYHEPWRHYHNIEHIHDCLNLIKLVPSGTPDRPAIKSAIWFHDVIYDPKGKGNEVRSANVASESLCAMGAKRDFIAATVLLIADTTHTDPVEWELGRYMVDIDLAILGAAGERFDGYERAIRQEYAHVSDAAFRDGRVKVLRRFLDRASIYMTDVFRTQFEVAARENLERSIGRLTSNS
jgi:predicted metal-dependent HD superfamily phosphohydrolase